MNDDQRIEALLREIRDSLKGRDGVRYGGSRFREDPRSRGPLMVLGGVLAGIALVMAVVVPGIDDDEDLVGSGASTELAGGAPVGGAAPVAAAAGAGVMDGSAGPSLTPVPGADGPAVSAGVPGGGGQAGAPAQGPAEPATGGIAASSPAPPPNSAACSGGATARGVTDKMIKLGVVIPPAELDEFLGDLKGMYEAQVDKFRKAGQLPVCGRDLQLVFHRYGLDEASQRAACVDLATDKKVFAATGWGIPLAGECLAREFQTPVLGSVYPIDEETIKRSWPYFFYTNMANGRVLRNFPHWAHAGGYLKDKKLGLFYRDDPTVKAQVDRNFKPNLQQLGYSLAAEGVQGGDQTSTAVAVQRFQAAGAQVIFIMAEHDGFSQAAETQGYRPQYLVAEYEGTGHTADGVVAGYLPSQWHGARAMTYYRRAEQGKAGQQPVPAAGKECVDDWARWSGEPPPNKQDAAGSIQWDAMQHPCDQMRALIKALHAAGGNLTSQSLVQGLETVRAQPSGEMADISFSPTKHDGPDLFKTLNFNQQCICWQHHSPFRPAWTP